MDVTEEGISISMRLRQREKHWAGSDWMVAGRWTSERSVQSMKQTPPTEVTLAGTSMRLRLAQEAKQPTGSSLRPSGRSISVMV